MNQLTTLWAEGEIEQYEAAQTLQTQEEETAPAATLEVLAAAVMEQASTLPANPGDRVTRKINFNAPRTDSKLVAMFATGGVLLAGLSFMALVLVLS